MNAGHGIHLSNLATLMQVPHLSELNVGHHLVSRGVFVGLRQAVSEMLGVMSCYHAVCRAGGAGLSRTFCL